MPKLTPVRREILERLRDAGRALSLEEAMGGRRNCMPTIMACKWAKYEHPDGYRITDEGLCALNATPPAPGASPRTP